MAVCKIVKNPFENFKDLQKFYMNNLLHLCATKRLYANLLSPSEKKKMSNFFV